MLSAYLVEPSAVSMKHIVKCTVATSLILHLVFTLDGILFKFRHVLRIEVRPFSSPSHTLILLVEWSKA